MEPIHVYAVVTQDNRAKQLFRNYWVVFIHSDCVPLMPSLSSVCLYTYALNVCVCVRATRYCVCLVALSPSRLYLLLLPSCSLSLLSSPIFLVKTSFSFPSFFSVTHTYSTVHTEKQTKEYGKYGDGSSGGGSRRIVQQQQSSQVSPVRRINHRCVRV